MLSRLLMLSRLQRFPIRRLCVHKWLCAGTLIVYLISTVGLPIGHHALAGNPRPGCRCAENGSVNGCCCRDAQSSTTGACCSPAAQSEAACCTAESPTPACCAAEATASCCETEKSADSTDAPEKQTPIFSSPGCGCGESPLSGVLINKDPRMHTAAAIAGASDTCRERRRIESVSLLPLSISPETPPPESESL